MTVDRWMRFLALKRIFKQFNLIFLCYIIAFLLIAVFSAYTISQEEEDDEDDIEWLDEDDEMESLKTDTEDEPEKNQESAKKDTVTEESTAENDSIEDIGEEDMEESASSDSNTETDMDTELSPAEVSDSSSGDEYERDLYETYIQYYSKKVSVEDWNSVVGGKDTYNIQEKDTLWDISQVLFGDPNYWPKLWSTNPFITNPHLIQPTDTLGFVHGTEGSPPSLSIITGGLTQTKKGSRTPRVLPEFLKGQKIEKFAPSKKLVPVLKNIPSSLPPLRLSKKQEESSDMRIEFQNVSIPTITALRNYMSDEPADGQGVVSDKKEYGSWFHLGQSVILEMRDPVDPGQKLTIVKNKGKLYSSKFGVRGPFGYQIEVQGEVEVVGRVPDSFDLYEARVTQSLHPIAIGSLVLRKSIIEFDYKPTDMMGNSEAQIIGVPSSVFDSYDKQIASPYSLVYLNRGSGSGLSVGQMYQIKANPSIERQMEYGYDIKMGELKIVYTENRFSTGVITRMNNPIHVGDYIASLDKGILTQRGYDPLDDDEVEEVGAEDAGFREFEGSNESSPAPPPASSQDEEPYDEEDVFEAFE